MNLCSLIAIIACRFLNIIYFTKISNKIYYKS